MKKLSKVALIGALSFGGFTAVEMIKPASEVQAAYSDPWNDEWGITHTNILMYIDKMVPAFENQVKDGYDNGNIFKMHDELTPQRPGSQEDIVKIFRVHDDGRLQRYITMNPTWSLDSKGDPWHTWTTQFNSAYPPGQYIVIAYINGHHSYSKEIIVNQ
ncbi:DUF5065 family protein [Bacillus sp. FSL R10-2789]|uniref:DUF5065 family protein n=1 Tax=Bacillus sp. FSL R10-2789 TaxID=2954662 RepID=UPI0030F7F50E